MFCLKHMQDLEKTSTVDHIFALHAMVSKHLKKNKKLYVAFVAFSMECAVTTGHRW